MGAVEGERCAHGMRQGEMRLRHVRNEHVVPDGLEVRPILAEGPFTVYVLDGPRPLSP